MYSFNSTVRYSETDEKGLLSITAMIDYLQDCSTFQSEKLGVGLKHLKTMHRGWFLAAWRIEIPDLPRFNDPITVSTWAYGFKGLYGYRNFTITGPDRKTYVRADSLWFLFDTEKGRPVRVEDEEAAPYLTEAGPRLSMPEIERKIAVAGEGRRAPEVIVAKHHLDTNHHVNNAQYVAIAREAVAEDFKISRIDAQYKMAAVLGDRMEPVIYKTERDYTVDLLNPDGRSYATVRMLTL